ncbi:hypothetical protein MMC17_009694 [Xylographa soralifera]|nr:hypothetical protein [Xylographa soralifera]
MTYGFDVLKHPEDELLDGARRLLQDLKANRPMKARPLLFLTHSLGGIILQQALMTNEDTSLHSAIRGIVFLSTVAAGSASRTDFGRVFDRLGNLFKLTVQVEEVERLHRICVAFNTWVQTFDLSDRICCVFETLPVYRVGVVVPEKNAVIENCTRVALSCNHIETARCDEESSVDYEGFINWLRTRADICKTMPGDQDTLSLLSNDSPRLGTYDPTGVLEIKARPAPDCREIITQPTNEDGTKQARKVTLLALALGDQGEYVEAGHQFQSAISQYTQLLGAKHPKTLFCMDKLSFLLREQCQYKAALEMCTKVLQIRSEHLETHDNAFLSSLGNLAMLLQYRGKYESAIALLRDSLDYAETRPLDCVVGTRMVRIFAKVLLDHGIYDVAELLLRDVIRASISRLKTDHPFILNCISDLAKALSKRGQLVHADYLFRYALDRLEMRLGTDHPYALRIGRRLAKLMLYERHYSDACLLLQRTLPILRSQLGPRHHETMSAMQVLASAFVLQGSILEGEQLLEELLNIQNDVLTRDNDHSQWVKEHRIWTSNVLKKLQSTDFEFKSQTTNLAQMILGPPAPAMRTNANNSDAGTESTTGRPLNLKKIASFVADLEDVDKDVLNALRHGSGMPRISRTSSFRLRVKVFTQNLIPHQVSSDSRDRDEPYGQFLRAAAIANDENSVQLLYNSKADTRVHGGFYGSALQAASLLGNTKVIKILSEGVNDESKPCGVFGNPLRAAVVGGDIASVQFLLDRYRELNSDKMMLSSSLEASLVLGREEIIQQLAGSKAAGIKAANEFFEEPFRQLQAETRKELKELRILLRQSRASSSYPAPTAESMQERQPFALSQERIPTASPIVEPSVTGGVVLHNGPDIGPVPTEPEFQIVSVEKPPPKSKSRLNHLQIQSRNSSSNLVAQLARLRPSHHQLPSRNSSPNLVAQLARFRSKKTSSSEPLRQAVASPVDKNR